MSLIAQIGADASNYNKVMSTLGPTANTASNQVTTALAKASKASEAMGGSIAKGSNQAGNALQNLSRVAQDAPFGFIGIQNNLNPLLESFQRLKQETGSTGGALKALVSSLTGAGGLGLALAVVSSAFTFYTMWQQKANKATKETTDTTQAYIDALDSASRAQLQAEQNGQSEITRLRILYTATQDHKLSLNQRNEAYDELSRKYQKFFPNAERERTLLGQNKKAYEELATAILQAAYAKAYEEEITTLEKERLVNQRKIVDLTKAETKEREKLNKSRSIKDLGFQGGMGGSGVLAREMQLTGKLNGLLEQKNALEARNSEIKTTQTELSVKAYEAEAAAHFKTETQLDDKNSKLKEQKGAYDLLNQSIGELKTKLQDAITSEAGQTIIGKLASDLSEAEQKLDAINEKIKNSLLAGGGRANLEDAVNPNRNIDTSPKANETDVGFDKAKQNLKELSALKGKSRTDSKAYQKELKEEDSLLKSLSNTIGQGLNGAFQAAISGTQSFADAFGEFITGLITKLIAAIAAAAVLAALLSFTGLSSFTSVGSAFGGSGSQLGSFANLVGQFSGVKLATGGITTGPTQALIGEGREQEAVLPLSHLNRLLDNNQNNSGGDLQLNQKLSGADLLTWISRANKQANRIGGKI